MAEKLPSSQSCKKQHTRLLTLQGQDVTVIIKINHAVHLSTYNIRAKHHSVKLKTAISRLNLTGSASMTSDQRVAHWFKKNTKNRDNKIKKRITTVSTICNQSCQVNAVLALGASPIYKQQKHINSSDCNTTTKIQWQYEIEYTVSFQPPFLVTALLAAQFFPQQQKNLNVFSAVLFPSTVAIIQKSLFRLSQQQL